MNQKKECTFCKLKDSNEVICKSKYFYCLFDRYPVNPGHMLIISKRHVDSFFNLKPEEWKDLGKIIQIAKREIENTDLKNLYKNFVEKPINETSKLFCQKILRSKFMGTKPKGYNLGINLEEVGGQTINHVHFHLIPRYENDWLNPTGGVRNVIPSRGNYKMIKLVRDKIPQILEKKGIHFKIRFVKNKKEKLKFLKEKLLEEVYEFVESGEKEELADILEVIESIKITMNWKTKELEKIRRKKKKARGGFSKMIVLKLEGS